MSKTYYGSFYGFSSSPFHITPDPSLLLLTETHQQALGAIEYGITSGKGFIVVTGEVGVGKTTVLRTCLDRIDSSKIKIIYLFNPAIATAELYATLLEELDFAPDPSLKSLNVLQSLMRVLLSLNKAGTQVVLAVDEAQNMPDQTLESLRILSNLETSKSKLLQIILVGQPELEATLKKHSLRQLAQRVAVRARIKALTLRQSFRYVQHRSQRAGRNLPLFTIPALWYIAVTARGIPRSINICCDNALINGYGHGAPRITLKIARESCRSLEYRSPFKRLGATTGLLAVLVCAVFFARPYLGPVASAPNLDQARDFGVRDGTNATPIIADPISSPIIAGAPSPSLPGYSSAPDALTGTPTSLTEGREWPANPPIATKPKAALAAPDPTFIQRIGVPKLAAVTDSGNHRNPQTVWKWFVRRGDTITKACRITYGVCDDQILRMIIDYNPQIGPNGIIRQGMVIDMPEQTDPAKLQLDSPYNVLKSSGPD